LLPPPRSPLFPYTTLFRSRGARLVFSCGWHITRDGLDVYSLRLKMLVKIGGGLARLARVADLDDQVEACRRVFASDTRWTVVRGDRKSTRLNSSHRTISYA